MQLPGPSRSGRRPSRPDPSRLFAALPADSAIGAGDTSRRQFLRRAATGGVIGASWLLAERARCQVVADPDRAKIEAALPGRAPAVARRPRKLLIFELNVNYGGHRSISTASTAFSLMGQSSGAFETTISRDPAVFTAGSLRQFDAVFFNNNVGNLFADSALRQNLVEFIYGGGGMLGVHGTSVAFTQWPGAIEDWPEFGIMLGARGANHRASDEHVFIRLDDPTHAVNRAFAGEGFDYRDEFFRVHEPYSRNRVRVLLSIDTTKTDMNQGPAYGKLARADGDYALAWVRQYGRGRVFYCTIAHNPSVFWDSRMLQFYLAATQFVLGDLEAPTTPSARLAPAVRAQEKLGWRLGLSAKPATRLSLRDMIDAAAQANASYVGLACHQVVGGDLRKPFAPGLSADEERQVRLLLDAAGVRLLTYHIGKASDDEAVLRALFEFARKMGVETVVGEPRPGTLNLLDRLCRDFDIQFAIESLSPATSKEYLKPAGVMQTCKGLSGKVGACGNLGAWLRAGISPIDAVHVLGDRLRSLDLQDLDAARTGGRDVPWGSGVARLGQLLQGMQKTGRRPTMFGMPYADPAPSAAGVAANLEWFNRATLALALGTGA